MIAELESCVREAWQEISDRRPQPRKLHFLKLGLEDDPDPLTALVLLVFAEQDRQPIAAAKIARGATSDDSIRLEAEKLELTRMHLAPRLARLLPRLLRLGTLNGRTYMLSTCCPGETELHHTWGARRARWCTKRMHAALGWALDVALSNPVSTIRATEWLGLQDANRLLQLLASRGWDVADLRRLEELVEAVLAQRWPAGFAHGDFFPGNVLFTDNSLSGVLDWGMSNDRVPHFFDMLSYELSFSLHHLGARGFHDLEEARAVHRLPGFRHARQRLAESGIETGPGSDARFAVLIAGILSSERIWGQRRAISCRFDQILRAEMNAALSM